MLGVTAEALRANICSKSATSLQREPVDPKFSVQGARPTNRFSSQKTRLNDLSYGIKIWTDVSSVLSQYTRLTDGPLDRVCIPCSAVTIDGNERGASAQRPTTNDISETSRIPKDEQNCSVSSPVGAHAPSFSSRLRVCNWDSLLTALDRRHDCCYKHTGIYAAHTPKD